MQAFFIYKTTNIITGKIYIGQRSTSLKSLDRKYLGSGVALSDAIKKYGRESFKRDIIELCESSENLNEREIFWIKELDSMNPKIGYNLAPGGKTINGRINTPEAEIKRKITREKNKDRYIRRIGELNPMFGIKGKDHHRFKVKHTEEAKIKIRENSPDRSGENNSNWGKHATPELSKKFSDRNYNFPKLTCPHCGEIGDLGNMKKHHFDYCTLNLNRKERKIYICIYCGKASTEKGLINLWHNENCKLNPNKLIS